MAKAPQGKKLSELPETIELFETQFQESLVDSIDEMIVCYLTFVKNVTQNLGPGFFIRIPMVYVSFKSFVRIYSFSELCLRIF